MCPYKAPPSNVASLNIDSSSLIAASIIASTPSRPSLSNLIIPKSPAGCGLTIIFIIEDKSCLNSSILRLPS